MKDPAVGPFYNNDANQGPVRRAPFWVGADAADKPWPGIPVVSCELYNHDAVPYESLMLGYFAIWHGEPVYRDKPNELMLGYSRDGWTWSRPDRRPFVGLSEDVTAWNWINIQSITGGCAVVGDKLYIYFSARGQGSGSTGMTVLRRDGFASMDGGRFGGTLTTRKVKFSGSHLFVNVDDPNGALRVEVLDENDKPIKGLMLDQCKPISVNKTLQEITWKGGKDLSSLAGKPVRFRFDMCNGHLYAFWVSPDAAGASRGYMASGGPGFTGGQDTVGMKGYQAVYAAPAASVVPAPALWPLEGDFKNTVAVSAQVPLFLAQGSPAVRYTTDGSDPEANSPIMSSPVVLKKDATVKARTYQEGFKPSEVVSANYVVKPDQRPPQLFEGRPNSVIKAWQQGEKLDKQATEVRLSVRTAAWAQVRYSDKPGVSFDDMKLKLQPYEGGLRHEASLWDVPTGTYVYYIKARDGFGNTNTEDYEIRFGVANAAEIAAPVQLEFNAAAGEIKEPMAIVENEEAATGKCVASGEKDKGTVSFTFTVPATADYIVYIHSKGPAKNAGSFYVSVDGGMEDIFDVSADMTDARRGAKQGKWNWDAVAGRDNRASLTVNPRIFPLSKGEHTLTFRAREAGTLLDQVKIYQQP